MNVLYTAVATASGGRDGAVVSDDGVLDLELAHPKELGGPDGPAKTNPEQLLAAGFSACFHNALRRVAERKKVDVEGSSITARVGLGIEGKAFGLVVTLVGTFPTLDEAAAKELMDAADQVCPFSTATRGNINVTLEIAAA